MHLISIISPIYNESQFIDKFLDSILTQDYPKEYTEVLLIDGMSTDGTRDKIRLYQKKYPFFRLLDNPHQTVPYALNIGIRQAKGDVIIRLDAHCEYPQNYFSRLVEELYNLHADNVGGVWKTLPAKDTAICEAIAIGSSHPFGVGGSAHKIGVKEIKQVDTVPFGCYRRDVFDKIGLFDEELTRNQDDEFNARLIEHGGKIYILPDLVIEYHARDSFSKMRRMYYQYGLFKPLVNKKLRKPASTRQFFPALFVIGIVAGGILSMVSSIIAGMYIAVLLIYLLLGLSIGIRSARKFKRWSLIVLMPYTFLNIHLSYGWGYIKGIWKVCRNQKPCVAVNR
jgi:glycosyltransferase involved in cell wall biosynthesis